MKFNSRSRRQTSPAERKKNVPTLESGRRPAVLTRTTRARTISEVLHTWNGIFFLTLKRKSNKLVVVDIATASKRKNCNYTITSGQIFASKRLLQSGLNNPEEKITSLHELFAEHLWYAGGTKQGYKGSERTFQAFLPLQSDL